MAVGADHSLATMLNTSLGAMIGVVLAESYAFKGSDISHFWEAVFLTVTVVIFTCNIWVAKNL